MARNLPISEKQKHATYSESVSSVPSCCLAWKSSEISKLEAYLTNFAQYFKCGLNVAPGNQVTCQKAFHKSEYAERVARVRSRMQQAEFDLIICQDPANMCFHFQSGVWLENLVRRFQSRSLSPTAVATGYAMFTVG